MTNSFRHANAAAQTAFRHAVLDNGYTPLPNHFKLCFLKGWDKVRPTHEMIDEWGRKLVYQATGLRVENGLCALDIDIDDADIVAEIWKRSAAQFPQLREALVRFGSGAKEAWFCRTDEQFSVIVSTGHARPGEDPEGEGVGVYRLEAFGGGHNRQMGAYGAHTMKPDNSGFEVEYEWDGGESPADVRLDALPLLTKAAVLTIAQIVSDVLTEHDWPRVLRSRVQECSAATVYDLTSDMRFECLDGVTRTLDQLADYATGGNARCSASWMGEPRFRNRTRCLVTLDHNGRVSVLETADWTRHMAVEHAHEARTLEERHRALAQALGDHGFELDEDAFPDAPAAFRERVQTLLAEWAWCGSRQVPCLPVNRPEAYAMTVNNFRITETRHGYEVEGPRGGITRYTPVDAWLTHPSRVDVDGYRFMPHRGPGIYESDEHEWVINSYRAPTHVPSGDDVRKANRRLWLDFMEHLLPRDEEREWFLDWLAYKKQHLNVPGVGVIMYASSYGVGRGSLFEFIGGVFGDRYVRSVTADTLMGATSQSQYTDWMADTLFVTTDEVLPEGDDGVSMTWRRKKAYEKLKERIDPKPRRMSIVRKTLPNYEDWVYASFLMATNHENAVPIPRGDRRLVVLTNSTTPLAMKPTLLRRLNVIRNPELDLGFSADVAQWLDERDVAHFTPHVAPDFEGKRAMQDANATEIENIVDDVLADLPMDWAPLEIVLERVEHTLMRQDIRDDFPNWRRLATDGIRTQMRTVGRYYLDTKRTAKRTVLARTNEAYDRIKKMKPSERIEEARELFYSNDASAKKITALRAGIREAGE